MHIHFRERLPGHHKPHKLLTRKRCYQLLARDNNNIWHGSPPSGVRGGRSGALKNVQGHVVSRDTWCPRRAVRERRRPSQDSWPSWDSTVLGQRKCPGTKRGVLGQPTPSQDGDCPGHRVSRDTFASRTPFASQDIPPDPQMECEGCCIGSKTYRLCLHSCYLLSAVVSALSARCLLPKKTPHTQYGTHHELFWNSTTTRAERLLLITELYNRVTKHMARPPYYS